MIDYDRTKEQLQIFLRMRLSLSLSLVAIPSSGFEEKKSPYARPISLIYLEKILAAAQFAPSQVHNLYRVSLTHLVSTWNNLVLKLLKCSPSA